MAHLLLPLYYYYSIFIIIIIHFENVTFFRNSAGVGRLPRVDNQTSGDTLQELTQLDHKALVEKYANSQLSTHGYWSQFFIIRNNYPFKFNSHSRGIDFQPFLGRNTITSGTHIWEIIIHNKVKKV